ncbi:hypothetical protein E4U54_005698 [Claviceps lovelessii]|nr:hypothetical protein E4U54_005698 [Claviceps lovelessii]
MIHQSTEAGKQDGWRKRRNSGCAELRQRDAVWPGAFMPSSQPQPARRGETNGLCGPERNKDGRKGRRQDARRRKTSTGLVCRPSLALLQSADEVRKACLHHQPAPTTHEATSGDQVLSIKQDSSNKLLPLADSTGLHDHGASATTAHRRSGRTSGSVSTSSRQ